MRSRAIYAISSELKIFYGVGVTHHTLYGMQEKHCTVIAADGWGVKSWRQQKMQSQADMDCQSLAGCLPSVDNWGCLLPGFRCQHPAQISAIQTGRYFGALSRYVPQLRVRNEAWISRLELAKTPGKGVYLSVIHGYRRKHAFLIPQTFSSIHLCIRLCRSCIRGQAELSVFGVLERHIRALQSAVNIYI